MADQLVESAPLADPTIAAYPFNLDHADLVLRSSDHIEFHVHRAVLAVASPVFATIFELPQPAAERGEPISNSSIRPVVDLSEHSSVLDALLRLCYPVAKAEIKELDTAFSVLRAAMKYEMDWPTSYLTKEIETSSITGTLGTPLQIWAAACRCGIETIARRAASSLIPSGNSTQVPDLVKLIDAAGSKVLEGITVGEYLQLKEFLSKKGKVDPNFRFLEPPTHRTESEQLENADSLDNDTRPHTQILFTSDIPYPDMVCCSSDGTEFQVHGAILALHSNTLKHRFRPEALQEGTRAHDEHVDSAEVLPAAPGSCGSNPPSFPTRLSLDTDAQVLSLLLSICYGDKGRPVLDFPLLARAISVAERYCMERAQLVVEELWDELARLHPLEAYFNAIQYGLTPRVLLAAKHVLSKGPLTQQHTPSTDRMPALPYYRLSIYVEACGTVVYRELSAAQDSWRYSEAYDEHRYSYSTKSGTAYIAHMYEQDWLGTYFDALRQEVSEYGLRRDLHSLLGPLSLVRRGIVGYAYCNRSQKVISRLLEIGDTLPQRMHGAIDQVNLEV
ncbi:hypothetical protein C8Q73DRAFT_696985 [Cubamyces lactineus]|nr:hypothetical protein C8Q73DRAFT_696985 [Cubamyces lactineus]